MFSYLYHWFSMPPGKRQEKIRVRKIWSNPSSDETTRSKGNLTKYSECHLKICLHRRFQGRLFYFYCSPFNYLLNWYVQNEDITLLQENIGEKYHKVRELLFGLQFIQLESSLCISLLWSIWLCVRSKLYADSSWVRLT